jgi:hypothetical protein
MKRRRWPPARDPVEAYTRRLAWWLPRCARQELLAEARRHLYDATARAERAGLDHCAAQRAAVRAFGPAWRVGLAAHRAYDSRLLAAVEWPLARFPRGLTRLPVLVARAVPRRLRRPRTKLHDL